MSDDIALDEIIIPTDDSPSRIRSPRGPRRPAPSADSDPDDLATVDEKVESFREDYPDGAIRTVVTEAVDAFGVPRYAVRALVWRYQATAEPDATAHSTRTHGVGEAPYSQYPLETAESVAIGRALRFLGYTGRTGAAPGE